MLTPEQHEAIASLSRWFWRTVKRGYGGPVFPPTPLELVVIERERAAFERWCVTREAERGRVLVGSPGWTERCAPLPTLRRTAA